MIVITRLSIDVDNIDDGPYEVKNAFISHTLSPLLNPVTEPGCAKTGASLQHLAFTLIQSPNDSDFSPSLWQ